MKNKESRVSSAGAELLHALHDVALHVEYPSVSIIMPTSLSVPEKLQDHIRLKNLIKQATEKLLSVCERREADPLIERMEALCREYDYSSSWHGIALFVNRSFGTLVKLPAAVEPHVVVGQEFHTLELRSLLQRMFKYWLLEVRHDVTHLYEGFDTELHEVVTPLLDTLGNPIQGFPLDSVKPHLGEPDREFNGRGAKDTAYFQNHMKAYLHSVDKELEKKLHEQQLPVIVVGTVENISLFKEVTKHAKNIIGYQHGDYATKHEFSKAIEPIIKAYFKEESQALVSTFVESEGSTQQAFGMQRLWLMAKEGRIQTLLIDKDLMVFGKVDPQNPEHLVMYEAPVVAQGTRNLVDLLIDQVARTGGNIVFVEPGSLKAFEGIGALLRY